MNDQLITIICSTEPSIKNQSLYEICKNCSVQELKNHCDRLDRFRRETSNLYYKVRALAFLSEIYLNYLPQKLPETKIQINNTAYKNLLKRRFEEAIDQFIKDKNTFDLSVSLSSALGMTYKQLVFQTLADQVKKCVRETQGNRWIFRTHHYLDHPLRIKKELVTPNAENGLFPLLMEATPVRLDISHSCWSDIFFLGMDFPEGAKVINISVDLAIAGKNQKSGIESPIKTFLRVIDTPVLRLSSIDLNDHTDIVSINELFDFASDYLGLLKAAVIASGLIPIGLEGSHQPIKDVLEIILPQKGLGIEIVSKVNDIPKGSRLAVSTNLLASLTALCMRATGQVQSLDGPLEEQERKIVASRAILGEWLGGSGGGWQDSGGIWPGMKLMQGIEAGKNDPEYGDSKGRLLPSYTPFSETNLAPSFKSDLTRSLVIVHGGLAQNVGPILEMVTEKYLLRSQDEWEARNKAIALLDHIIEAIKIGDIKAIGHWTHKNFSDPIQRIIPAANNLYTNTLIEKIKQTFTHDFWGFWMMGGISGGGMGFLFNPARRDQAKKFIQTCMIKLKKKYEKALPFAIEPVVYDFKINEQGSTATLINTSVNILPLEYYIMNVPIWLKKNTHELSHMEKTEIDLIAQKSRLDSSFQPFASALFDQLMPEKTCLTPNEANLNKLLQNIGFDEIQHEQIRNNLRLGKFGIGENRLPPNTTLDDINFNEIIESWQLDKHCEKKGKTALESQEIAVITLAGGVGSRWTEGAGVVKSINPFCRIDGVYRTFIEIQLAKSLRTSQVYNIEIPHVITTSYLTHEALQCFLELENFYSYPGKVYLSPSCFVGRRLIPTKKDLHYFWHEMPHQLLDEQAQKVLESYRNAILRWVQSRGEASDYTENEPYQCINPIGHWYEIPNLLLNGVLKNLLERIPTIKYLMVHNVDTLGAHLDPYTLGVHIKKKCDITFEVINRRIEDTGGGLAKVDGKIRLIEGLALPSEDQEMELTYYNSNTCWITLDRLLHIFGLSRNDLDNTEKIKTQIRHIAEKMPTYITLKNVKQRWGKGQEDIFPVVQYEKIWGDMSALPDLACQYIKVPRKRGQQLKEPAHLDMMLRDGTIEYISQICQWA